VLHYAYAVWRPTVVTRSATAPWTDFWQSRRPYDEPIGVQCSALTRGGKSRGAEAPQCTKNALGIAAERDSNNRLKLAYEYADWNRHWVLHFGTVSTDNSLVINPNYITSWEMFKGLRAVANSFEGIVLKK